jgi:hypothetical protein
MGVRRKSHDTDDPALIQLTGALDVNCGNVDSATDIDGKSYTREAIHRPRLAGVYTSKGCARCGCIDDRNIPDQATFSSFSGEHFKACRRQRYYPSGGQL